MVHQQGMHDLQDTWNEVPQLNFFTKDKENSRRIHTKDMKNTKYLNKSVGMFARGVFKEFGKLTLKMSLVYLQGYRGWCCSLLMTPFDLSHKTTTSIEVMYCPLPFVTWSIHSKSSMQNVPE